jgi:hypothetical protein
MTSAVVRMRLNVVAPVYLRTRLKRQPIRVLAAHVGAGAKGEDVADSAPP